MISSFKLSQVAGTSLAGIKLAAISGFLAVGIVVAAWTVAVSSVPEPHDYAHASVLP